MSNFKDIIVPVFTLIAQIIIFYSVESMEMKMAMGIFAIYQIWNQSRRIQRDRSN